MSNKNKAKTKVEVGLVQQSMVECTQTNLQTSLELIENAKKQGAELIVLPELHRSLYFCQTEDTNNFDLAESIPGETTEAISKVCRERKVTVVSSVFEKRAAGIYHNTAVVIGKDGEIAGKYRKMHIPDDPGFYEKFYFTPGEFRGDLGFEPIKVSISGQEVSLGVLICWDQWFPEAARIMAMKGADILIYPTAIGWCPDDEVAEKNRQLESWITIQRSHAIANGLPVVSVNRVGNENPLSQPLSQSRRGEFSSCDSPGIDFWGNSFACGQQGEFLQKASADKQEIVITEIDLNKTEETRRIWPFFRDRRVDSYGELLHKWCK